MLIERKHDRIAVGQPLEDQIERTALADAEAGREKRRVTSASSQHRLDRAANKVDAVAHLGKMREPGHRSDLEVAEMTRQYENALAARERRGKHIDVFHAHRSAFLGLRHPSKAQELAEQPPQMRVMRLREVLDFGLRDRLAEHAAQVFENHRPAYRQEAIQDFAG
jgi:hypothetical protein